MDLICASVSSVIGLASLTYTARPSTATGNSRTSLPRLALVSAFSASFIGRDASQISVVPLISAAIPVPEPPPVTWMVKPGFLLMKTSAQRWPRMTMVSEPFTVMLRPSAIKATAPVTSKAAVAKVNFEIFLMFFPPSYSCSSMDPNCFSSVTVAEQLELVDDVELQALQPRLGRSAGGDMPVERAPDQTGEGQLNVLVGLVEDFDAVLADVAVLPEVAEVKRAHDGFAFDEHACVGELKILGFRLAADQAFEPIAKALAREATPPGSGNGGDGGRRRDNGVGSGAQRRNVFKIGTGARVLDVVAEDHDRQTRHRRLDVKTRNRVQQSKLGSKLGVDDRRRSRRKRGRKRVPQCVCGQESLPCRSVDNILDAGTTDGEQAIKWGLGVATRRGQPEGDGIGVVVVVVTAVGAQSEPVGEFPYGLDLTAVDRALDTALVRPSTLDLSKRQFKADECEAADDRSLVREVPLKSLRYALWVEVIVPSELGAVPRVGKLASREGERLELA